ALLLALAPFHVVEAQEARNYALLALLAACSYYCFLRLLERPGPWLLAGYVAATAAMLYTHLFGLFVLAAQIVYVAALLLLRAWRGQRWRDDALRWTVRLGLPLVLFVPWLAAIFGGDTWVSQVAKGTEILVRPSVHELTG